MLIRRPNDIRPSEITPESVFLNRRAAVAALLGAGAATALPRANAADAAPPPNPTLVYTKNARYTVANDSPNTWSEITGYNNFYEFGTEKTDPARNAFSLKPKPWTCLLYTSPSPRDRQKSRMPSSA